MSRFQTILCPTDFSPLAARAFEYACDLARTSDARLVVMHAFFPAVLGSEAADYVPEEVTALRAAARKQLDDLRPADPAVRVERLLREAPAAQAILDAAAEWKADLIVMGSHGRTGVRRLVLGSVTEEVLRMAPCPVLTVKGPTP